MAYDAYIGVKLWERTLRGALRDRVTHDARNSAANHDNLRVAIGSECLQLDAAPGETKRRHKLPPATDSGPHSWGYGAVIGDTLFGSRTAKGRTADCIFAIDTTSGRQLWVYETDGIAQGAIAISKGRLHFAVSRVTRQQREQASSPQTKEPHVLTDAERAALLKKLDSATVYNIVALDAVTGERLREQPFEV